MKELSDEQLASKFHETYERLAPSFGYETRKETRQFDPTTPNGKLMIAVCGELLNGIGEAQPWVGLTDAEKADACNRVNLHLSNKINHFIRIISAKLREKNAAHPAADEGHVCARCGALAYDPVLTADDKAAEPVAWGWAWRRKEENPWTLVVDKLDEAEEMRGFGAEVVLLHTTPPTPAVPEGWQPIDTAKDGDIVLAYGRNAAVPGQPMIQTTIRIDHLRGHWTQGTSPYPFMATHCRPLLAAPGQKEEG